jgi:hypothetical protein
MKSIKSNLSINIYWIMEDDEYIKQFNELRESFPDYKFKKNNGRNINQEIYEESIIITSGSIFRKNIKSIEGIFFPCKIYIYDNKSQFHENLPDDFPYVQIVTKDLGEVLSNLEKDALELSKIIIYFPYLNFSQI